MIIYCTNLYLKKPTHLTMAAGDSGTSPRPHTPTLQSALPAKPNSDDFAQGCATGAAWQSFPAKSTGQGGLGWTTGFTEKIPADPYLQRSPMPPPVVPGWGASRSCPAVAWGQQWGVEPSPPPTEQTGAGAAARQGRRTTTPRSPRASLPRWPGLPPRHALWGL